MTLVRALAAAGLAIHAVTALPSAMHHVGVDVTLIPDLDAPVDETRNAADHISIMGPISLSAVDLGITGSKGEYQAAMLNIGDQGLTVNFKTKTSDDDSMEPIRKTISPMLDGLCSASTNNAEPCAKKTSEIEVEASRAIHGNHEVTIFTLKLARLDNKKVEPPMIAQFAFDGAETSSLIFLTDVPPPPHHVIPPPPPPPCDTLMCRVAGVFHLINPFAKDDRFHGPHHNHNHHNHNHHHNHDDDDDDEHHGMGGPHMHHGPPPGPPGLGMRPGNYHDMHHGGKPEEDHKRPQYHHGPGGSPPPPEEEEGEGEASHPSPFDGDHPEDGDVSHPPHHHNHSHGPPHGGPPQGGPPHGGPPHGGPPHGGPPHGGPPHGDPPHGGPHHGPHPNGTEPFPHPPHHEHPDDFVQSDDLSDGHHPSVIFITLNKFDFVVLMLCFSVVVVLILVFIPNLFDTKKKDDDDESTSANVPHANFVYCVGEKTDLDYARRRCDLAKAN